MTRFSMLATVFAIGIMMAQTALADTLTIGYSTSMTGSQSVDATSQERGFQMWRSDVNRAGGIKAGDKTYQVKFVSYDDQSSSPRVPQLYAKLIAQDKVDFLFSPYSSSLAANAAVVSEQYGKLLLMVGAAEQKTFELGNKGLYQLYTPGDHYLDSAIQLLKRSAPDAKVALVFSDDSFSREVASAARSELKAAGIAVVLDENYDPNTADFGPQIARMASARADVLLGGGHYPDGAAFARQIHDQNLALRFVSLLVAPDADQFARLGDAANGISVPSQWEPSVSFKPDFGPTPSAFARAYQTSYDGVAPYHAAGGYAAGLVLQHAIETAGSIEQPAVAKALDATDLTLFYGHVKFATGPDEHGLQIAHEMALAQWQRQKDGSLVKEVIAPEAAQTAQALFFPKRKQ